MNNIQVNGQRRWGPPERWTGPPPAHGTEVFIKNLPEEIYELEIYTTFSSVGLVYEVRLPVNWDGLNRGYAFVRFTTIEEADQAIRVFHGYEIRRNRKIKVTRSVDNTRLFLSAVPADKNAEQLKQDLLNYVENVRKVYVYPTLENSSIFRGYAFVEFETHRDAAIAKRILTPDVCYGIFEKKCIVAWANPLPFLDRSLLNSINVLFMRNLPKDIKGCHIKRAIEILNASIDIKRVKKINNFAFLTFKDHKSAERALHQLQCIPLFICDHEIQVEWAIPREIIAPSGCATEKEVATKYNVRGDEFQSEGISFFREDILPRFSSNLDASSENPDVHFREFSNSSAAVWSTTSNLNYQLNDICDKKKKVEHASRVRLRSGQEGKGDKTSLSEFRKKYSLPLSAVPSSYGNSRMKSENIVFTLDSSNDLTAINYSKKMGSKMEISVISNGDFNKSNSIHNISNVENSEYLCFSDNNQNHFHGEETFLHGPFERPDSSPCSTVSPSPVTSLSSGSPLLPSFFPHSPDIFQFKSECGNMKIN